MKNVYLSYKSKFDKYTILICLLCLVYLFIIFTGIISMSACALVSDTVKVEKVYRLDSNFEAAKQFENRKEVSNSGR